MVKPTFSWVPNASGKTTLVLTLIGYPAYKVTKGRIIFDGKDISRLRIDERARLGIGVASQHPPAIRGVKLGDLLRLCAGLEPWNPSKEPCEPFASRILKEVGMDPRLYLNSSPSDDPLPFLLFFPSSSFPHTAPCLRPAEPPISLLSDSRSSPSFSRASRFLCRARWRPSTRRRYYS